MILTGDSRSLSVSGRRPERLVVSAEIAVWKSALHKGNHASSDLIQQIWFSGEEVSESEAKQIKQRTLLPVSVASATAALCP